MKAANALARTIDLVRADVFPRASDEEVLNALTDVQMRIAADERNLSSAAGQTAFVTAALVAAQSGATLVLDLPDIELLNEPPLRGARLGDALIDLTSDLIVPAVRDDAPTCDLTIALGSTRVSGSVGNLARLSPTTLVLRSCRAMRVTAASGTTATCSRRCSEAWLPAHRRSEPPCGDLRRRGTR